MLRRSFFTTMLGLFNASASLAPDRPAPVSDAETAYYQRRAALLDPRAYVAYGPNASGWATVVPNGETWYALSLLNVDWGDNHNRGYLRRWHVDEVMGLPAGTVIKSFGVQTGSFYYCNPALVTGLDSRYTDDPRALYYGRLTRLETLPWRYVRASVANGAARGTTGSANFPTDFTYGMVVGASIYDAAWVALGTGWNLFSEVNNQHSVRFAGALLAPFSRVLNPGILMSGGNLSGNLTDTCLAGEGQVYYRPLPDDW